jgi:hypothetical protein
LKNPTFSLQKNWSFNLYRWLPAGKVKTAVEMNRGHSPALVMEFNPRSLFCGFTLVCRRDASGTNLIGVFAGFVQLLLSLVNFLPLFFNNPLLFRVFLPL